MRKINQIIARVSSFFVVLLALQIPGAALAHEGPARIELNTQQSSSGAELEIRGVNIAPEQPIMLSLVGDGANFALGTTVGDIHGDFVVGVRLPAEAPAGTYIVRAFGSNRVIVTAPLTLLGLAAEEEGAQRDQDEPLLAPMPQPRAAPASPASASAPPLPTHMVQQPGQAANWIAISVVGLVAVLIVAVIIRRRTGGAAAQGSRLN